LGERLVNPGNRAVSEKPFAGRRSYDGLNTKNTEAGDEPMTETQKRKRTESATAGSGTWTDDEREAMKARAKEMKAEAKRGARNAEGEQDLLAKIAEMVDSDRVMAERIHAIVKAEAPDIETKTWYGMPAYAKDGKVVCFFKSAGKFGSRYATLGFEEQANLDEGTMWPTSYALTEVTPEVEERIRAIVKQALS
jgi:uncharacterized protein YdhG (YjbR/CyaY superfamily)